ncbi:uncharacterized protein FOMMEDRAFT_144475 [Fomitiporia mediterranea MF3/22]|uniref:uncharacterized protein n=1 Tax=Fomitiporia mediterranea (strain MF3/22) TaxID=694068 RepID=UPI000440931C|nr:uncharacterized protein FOMMEDRAFT_144475 [Fomitiporia mediterranea MF3/22]EJD06420.1 hypothetical protein FOMMEDRAFT_144475 [Fomitiporia mediterranea MF3/22]
MASTAAAVSVKDTFGSAYIGAMIMMILYGITCLQTYLFFFNYPKDSLPIKFLVSVLWVLDTFHISLVSHTMYHYLITNFNNVPALDIEVWSLPLSLGMNVVIAFLVQCFFTHKIHGLSGRNWWITVPTALFVVAHFGFGIETMVEFFIKGEFRRLSELLYYAALPFAITAIISDVAITAALCYLLQHKKTSFQSTNTLINYLILYAINRCLLTSIMAIVEVIVFVTLPNTFWFLAIDFIIGKCYVNSLLATLNSRHALRGKGLDMDSRGKLSTEDGFSPTTIEIAGVTPSMISRSRMQTQTGNMSSSCGGTSRTTETKSIELKELKTPTDEIRAHVSIVSHSDRHSCERGECHDS